MPSLRPTSLDAMLTDHPSTAGLVALPVRSEEDANRLISVLDEIWGGAAGSSHLDHGFVIALAHAGDYAVLFEKDGRAVGGGVGFFGPPRAAILHSHIVGVLAEVAGGGIGLAIKHHQRQWCLERDVRAITWTFDPLVGRNAAFNLRKLGARVEHYLENFYGDMTDGINAGQATDRVHVRWELDDPASAPADLDNATPWVIENSAGDPVVNEPDPAADRRLIHVPVDIEQLRRTAPERARLWRTVVRETLGWAMAEGWSVIGFRTSGEYVLERTSE